MILFPVSRSYCPEEILLVDEEGHRELERLYFPDKAPYLPLEKYCFPGDRLLPGQILSEYHIFFTYEDKLIEPIPNLYILVYMPELRNLGWNDSLILSDYVLVENKDLKSSPNLGPKDFYPAEYTDYELSLLGNLGYFYHSDNGKYITYGDNRKTFYSLFVRRK